MGRRGPPPTPTTVLHMRGTFRNDRHGGTEPAAEPLAKIPTAPKHLGDIAKRFWRKRAKYLVSVGLLTEADLGAFEGYCVTYERAVEAEAVVVKEGRTLTTIQGTKRHPELLTAEKARQDMRRYEIEFGLTPAARARLRTPSAPAKPPENRFSRVARAAQRAGA